jgi:drug/metabolite transporter (DMT)-like permease
VSLYHENLFLILGIAIVSSLIAMILFLRGLQKIKSAEVSILSTSEPVTAVALASFFLGESLSVLQFGGGILVLASLILLAKKKAPD